MAQTKEKKKRCRRDKEARINRVVFLGTSSAQPIPLKRNVSSLVIQTTTGNLWMVDCGEGTQHQMKISTLKTGKLRNIFITHLHGDHCYGLFGLLHSITMSNLDIELNIYGPKGLKKMIQTTLYLSGGLTHFKYKIHEISLKQKRKKNKNNKNEMDISYNTGNDTDSTDASMMDNDDNDNHNDDDNDNENEYFSTLDTVDLGEIEKGIKCIACRISHRIECFGYVFIENNSLGKLDAKKAKSLGAKGRQLGDLKNGKDVILENGTKILSCSVVGDSINGKKCAIMQDCNDCRSCFEIAKNCDLFIHECTYDESNKQFAIPRGHSTAKMAALNAIKIDAKMLMLTHFSSRFVESGVDQQQQQDEEMKNNDNDNDENEENEEDLMHVQRLQKEAEDEIKKFNKNCIVRCAADFMSVSFGKNKIKIDKELAVTPNKKIHFKHDLEYLKLVSE